MEHAWPVHLESTALSARTPSYESGSERMNKDESSTQNSRALPWDAADITCVVDDDPAPRSQASDDFSEWYFPPECWMPAL
eukprot:1157785-Pelagomonas_calceolata.AAC.9